MLEWLLDQGLGAAYTVLLALSITAVKWTLIGVLFFIAWWEKIR